MKTESYRWYSHRVGREMGLVVYGHYGLPVLAFPTSGGGEWELENMGLLPALAPYVDAGRVKFFTVGSNSDASWYNTGAHPFHRSWMQRMFDEYIRWEVIPVHPPALGRPAADRDDGRLARRLPRGEHPLQAPRRGEAVLGDVWRLRHAPFHGRLQRRQLLLQQPDRLPRWDARLGQIGLLNTCDIHIATGHGPWEKPEQSYALSRVLAAKGVHHHLDDWGPQGGHDWPFWKHQMWNYLSGV